MVRLSDAVYAELKNEELVVISDEEMAELEDEYEELAADAALSEESFDEFMENVGDFHSFSERRRRSFVRGGMDDGGDGY